MPTKAELQEELDTVKTNHMNHVALTNVVRDSMNRNWFTRLVTWRILRVQPNVLDYPAPVTGSTFGAA